MVVTAPILATGWQPSVFDTVDSVAKESSCNAGDGDLDSIPGSGRSPEKGNGNPLRCYILPREIPWTEEPGPLQSVGLQELDTAECACKHHILNAY